MNFTVYFFVRDEYLPRSILRLDFALFFFCICRPLYCKIARNFTSSPTRDPKSKLYWRTALLSEETDLVFPRFPPSPVTIFENYPFVQRPTRRFNDKGVKPPLCYHFLSRSAARETTRRIKETGERISDEIVVVVEERNSTLLFECIHLGISICVANHIRGNSIRAPSLSVCMYAFE